MRAIEAETFSGYRELRQIEVSKQVRLALRVDNRIF